MKTKWAIGCYGDGAFGHQHTRTVCADVLTAELGVRRGYIPQGQSTSYGIRADLLREPMSDDAREEYLACEALNTLAAVEGASWSWQDGDFGLWPNTEEG